MLPDRSYAQILRAIGQDLESAGLRYFEIKTKGKDYVVHPATSPESQELRFTDDDIVRLEREGRAKRSDPSRTPDFSSISQILRAIGHYIDRKDGYLLEVSKAFPSLAARSVRIQYRTAMGNRVKEEFSASDLYSLCVRMHKQRGQ
jgi:hypothetical protein